MQSSVTELLHQFVLDDIKQTKALLQYDPLNNGNSVTINLPSSDVILQKIYSTINSKQNSKSFTIEQRTHKTSFTMDQGSSHNIAVTKCNCKKSKCLKLYCQCFSQGRPCKDCNCFCCQNTEQHQQQRAKAIDQVLGRSCLPFLQRISSIRGCNCKKTGCQKKYCECYSNGDKCNQYCKCQNCLNSE